MNRYIADLHFGHKGVLSFDDRPFKTIEENDIELVDRWNRVTDIDDDVYILGDISWHGVMKTIDIIQSLNGNKHLIIGNHDKKFLKNKDFREEFVEIAHYKEVSDGNKIVVLCHYPIMSYNGMLNGRYHLYGHVHTGVDWNILKRFEEDLFEEWKTNDRYGERLSKENGFRMFNVGCMLPYMNYTPLTLDEIEAGVKEYRSVHLAFMDIFKPLLAKE